MASEEQYLDQLLNNMMAHEPKPRSMNDVMKEMRGFNYNAQNETFDQNTEISIEKPIDSTNEREINADTLADMLDLLDTPDLFAEPKLIDEEPVIEEPVVEEQIVEKPVFEEPVVEEPIFEVPVFEEPVIEEPIIEEPVVEEPIFEVPVFEEPVLEEPIIEEPIIEETIITESVEEEPTIEEPIIEEPSFADPMLEMNANPEEILAKMSNDDFLSNLTLSDIMNDTVPNLEEIDEVSSEPIMENIVPEMAVPEETIFEENVPEVSVPEENIPKESIFEENIPEVSIPEENIPEETIFEENIPEVSTSEENIPEESIFEENISEISIPEENIPEETIFEENVPEVSVPEENIPEEIIPEENIPEEDASQDDLAELLAGLDLGNDDDEAGVGDTLSETETANASETADAEEAVRANEEPSAVDLFNSMGESDEDLLALLEGIDENAGGDEMSSDSSNDEIGELLDNSKGKKRKKGKKEKKEKKPFVLPFFGKKKDKTTDEIDSDENVESLVTDSDLSENDIFDENVNDSVAEDITAEILPDENQLEALLSSIGEDGEPVVSSETEDSKTEDSENTDSKAKKGKKDKKAKNKKAKATDGEGAEKKQGFFAKLLALLTEEEEEEESGEVKELSNEEILEQLDSENPEDLPDKNAKKGKKAKKEKKGKKGKEAAKSEDGEGGDEEGGSTDGKKGKKPKKEKKPKEPKEPKEKEPTKRVLSKKATICLVAFCMTLVAAVVIFSSILPEHAEVKKARNAYYLKDYDTVYNNLYGKKLNESDAIIFERANSILMMERRYDSYVNRMKLGDKVAALDSLLEGVNVYGKLAPEANIDTLSELNQTYQSILSALESEFGMTESDAVTVYAIEDKGEYTDKLYSIVYDPVWYLPGEEPAVSEEAETSDAGANTVEETADDTESAEESGAELEDMLPEEEEINSL